MAKKQQIDWIPIIKERGCMRCPHSNPDKLRQGILECSRWDEAVTDKDINGGCNVLKSAIETRIAERAMTFRQNFKASPNPSFRGYTDERCQCGDLRSEHNDVGLPGDNMPVGLMGHGACLKCACLKYRWDTFVYYDPDEKEGIDTRKRIAFFILDTRKNDKGEYNALIAVEGERGFYPTDWYWGADKEMAQDVCDKRNARLGLSKKEAAMIQCSTMRQVKMPEADPDNEN